MTLTLALVEILLSPYPESLQSTQNILDNGAVAERGPSNSALVNHPVNYPNGAGFSANPPCPPNIADAPLVGTDGVGATIPGGNGDAPEAFPLLPPSQIADKFAGELGLPQGTAKCGAATSLTSPAIHLIDRHGDDRFTDNILRACRNLAQNGDDEEERDAAEEGALIEASGYPDPKFESNGRY